MTEFTYDDIVTGLNTTQQGIAALREEHTSFLQILEANYNADDSQPTLSKEKLNQLNDNLDNLSSSETDTALLLLVTQLIRSADIQKVKSQENQRMLRDKNDWLVEELSETQQRLQESEKINGQLEEELKHYKFLDSVRNIKGDIQCSTLADENSQSSAIDTLQDLGFAPEDEESDVNHNLYHSNTNSANSSTSPSRLTTLTTLVIQYMRDGRFDIAGPLGKQALEDLISIHGPTHPDVAKMLSLLAMVYRDQQKYKEAAHYLEEALAIREKCFGENHLTTAANLNNLAIVLGKRGKYKEAEIPCKRALKIREVLHGTDHIEVAKQLTNLGLLCLNLGKYEEVENCHHKALNIYESKLGVDDPSTIKAQTHLASIYLKLGKYEEAEKLYKLILSRVHEKEFGKTSMDDKPIWEIAEDRESRKRKGESFRSIKFPSSTSYLDSEYIVSTLKNLSALYRKREEYEAAEFLENVALRKTSEPDEQDLDSHSASSNLNEDSRGRVVSSGIKSKLLSVLGFKT